MPRRSVLHLVLLIAVAAATSWTIPLQSPLSAHGQAGAVSFSIGLTDVTGNYVFPNPGPQPPPGIPPPGTPPLPGMDWNVKTMPWTITGGQVCTAPGSCVAVPGTADVGSATTFAVVLELTSNPPRGFPGMGRPCQVRATYEVQRTGVPITSSLTGTVRGTGVWAQLNGQVVSAGQPLFEVDVPWPTPFALDRIATNNLPPGVSAKWTQIELSPNSPKGPMGMMCGG